MTSDDGKATFWEHLDILRGAIVRTIALWSVFSIIAFVFKEQLFDFVLAPKSPDFVAYGVINGLCARFGVETLSDFHVELINTGLAQQFLIHLKTALCAGVVVVAPFALYQIFSFVSPALYSRERRYFKRVIVSSYLMFVIGVALSYYVIFPLTFRFLGTYQVAADVVNLISLESYMSTLIMMSLCMGILFELPVLAWLLAKMGFVSASLMSRYRKHAIVVILIVAAVITPTSDIFTLMLVSVPIWLLYEISALMVRRVQTNQQ
ncbi:MAG: twin-arginine translocase subunit TatC [Paramuribaculum sp.]|nr:twin-arginine translocase subunit TatC [Paramuribaculum sp.]MDE6782644.1 twin-arginine translocase subunit TatC [Paramuribaculum sp.]